MTHGHVEQDTPHTNYVIAATGDGARMIAAALRSDGRSRSEADAMAAWNGLSEKGKLTLHVWRVEGDAAYTRATQLTDGIELR